MAKNKKQDKENEKFKVHSYYTIYEVCAVCSEPFQCHVDELNTFASKYCSYTCASGG